MIKFGQSGRIDEETAFALYRDAPNKSKEIRALADLLVCKPVEVREWLTARGAEVPLSKVYTPRGKRKAWTLKEEKRLLKAFKAGKEKTELSKLFGRSVIAISSKLNSLKNKAERVN